MPIFEDLNLIKMSSNDRDGYYNMGHNQQVSLWCVDRRDFALSVHLWVQLILVVKWYIMSCDSIYRTILIKCIDIWLVFTFFIFAICHLLSLFNIKIWSDWLEIFTFYYIGQAPFQCLFSSNFFQKMWQRGHLIDFFF